MDKTELETDIETQIELMKNRFYKQDISQIRL